MKLLVTQALDRRDLLVKKINDKIRKASFVDTVKENETKVLNARIDRAEFEEKAKSAYQQINDLISQFTKLDAAISASNASTVIHTAKGDMTVAAAISFRGRMKGMGSYDDADFEQALMRKMADDLQNSMSKANAANKKLESDAEAMRLTILGKEAKNRDDKPLAVVDAYIKENTTVLADPLNAKDKVEELSESIDALLKEIDTQIKISNATTFIEIDD